MAENNNDEPVELSYEDWLNQLKAVSPATKGKKGTAKVVAPATGGSTGRPAGRPGATYRGKKVGRRPKFPSKALGEETKRKAAIAASVDNPQGWRNLPLDQLPASKVRTLTAAPKPMDFADEHSYLDALDKHVTGKVGEPHTHPWTLLHTYDALSDTSIRPEYRAGLKPNPTDGSRPSYAIKNGAMRVAAVLKALNPSMRIHSNAVMGTHTWQIWGSPQTCDQCAKSRKKSAVAMPPTPENEPAPADLSSPAAKLIVKKLGFGSTQETATEEAPAAPKRVRLTKEQRIARKVDKNTARNTRNLTASGVKMVESTNDAGETVSTPALDTSAIPQSHLDIFHSSRKSAQGEQ